MFVLKKEWWLPTLRKRKKKVLRLKEEGNESADAEGREEIECFCSVRGREGGSAKTEMRKC